VKKGIRSLEPALDENNKDPLGYLGKAKYVLLWALTAVCN